jgi:hypothetical protein
MSMSGPHDPNKKLVTFWASDEEKALLQQAYKAAGFSNLADYLRWIAQEQPRPGEHPKAKS